MSEPVAEHRAKRSAGPSWQTVAIVGIVAALLFGLAYLDRSAIPLIVSALSGAAAGGAAGWLVPSPLRKEPGAKSDSP